jgi:hypothetical protein
MTGTPVRRTAKEQGNGNNELATEVTRRYSGMATSNESNEAANFGGTMFDLIYVGATVAFFLLALAYVRGCEKLQ